MEQDEALTDDDACGREGHDTLDEPHDGGAVDLRGDAGALAEDAVSIRIRDDEIVVKIKTSALVALAGSRRRSTAPERSPTFESGSVLEGAPSAIIGTQRVAADAYRKGLSSFDVRRDLVASYRAVHDKVRALGGILTSSGGLRGLSAPITAGRSRTSLHYTARAIDLYVGSAMQGMSDRYLVARDGGDDERPEWKLYCQSTDPIPTDPDYDESLIQEGELEHVLWRKKVGTVTVRRTLRYFCLTDVLAAEGWMRIPSRTGWRNDYMSTEWWHFQNHSGLVVGASTLGQELRKVWPASQVATSGLALGALWRGRAFQ